MEFYQFPPNEIVDQSSAQSVISICLFQEFQYFLESSKGLFELKLVFVRKLLF